MLVIVQSVRCLYCSGVLGGGSSWWEICSQIYVYYFFLIYRIACNSAKYQMPVLQWGPWWRVKLIIGHPLAEAVSQDPFLRTSVWTNPCPGTAASLLRPVFFKPFPSHFHVIEPFIQDAPPPLKPLSLEFLGWSHKWSFTLCPPTSPPPPLPPPPYPPLPPQLFS